MDYAVSAGGQPGLDELRRRRVQRRLVVGHPLQQARRLVLRLGRGQRRRGRVPGGFALRGRRRRDDDLARRGGQQALGDHLVGLGGRDVGLRARPSYQNGFQSSTNRGVPDVAYDADPNSGIYVLDNGSYYEVGGTSAGSPQWAGLAALVNQGRVANGLATIGTGLTYGLNSALYSLAGGSSYTNPNGDFLDITSGSNGNAATAGLRHGHRPGQPGRQQARPRPDRVRHHLHPPSRRPWATPASRTSRSAARLRLQPDRLGLDLHRSSRRPGNSSAFTAGNPAAPQGTQVAFLQNRGRITQTVANFAAGSYTISFRPPNGPTTARRTRPSRSSSTAPSSAPSTPPAPPTGTSRPTFTVAAGSHTISFVGMGPVGGDNTAFLDIVTIATATTPGHADGGRRGLRERPEGPAVGLRLRPDRLGLDLHRSGRRLRQQQRLHRGQPRRTPGHPGRLPAEPGTITQTVASFAAGSYTISLSPRQRANYGTSNETFQVLVDGTVVGTFNPPSTSYASLHTSTFTVAAGGHTISFVGMGSATATTPRSSTTVDPHRTPRPPRRSATPASRTFRSAVRLRLRPQRLGLDLHRPGRPLRQQQRLHLGNPAAPQGTQVAFLQNQGVDHPVDRQLRRGQLHPVASWPPSGLTSASNETFVVLVDATVVGTSTPEHDLPDLHHRVFSVAAGATRSRSWAWVRRGATTPSSSTTSRSAPDRRGRCGPLAEAMLEQPTSPPRPRGLAAAMLVAFETTQRPRRSVGGLTAGVAGC